MESPKTVTVPQNVLKEGMKIWVWNDTSANNIPAEWVLATVIKPLELSVHCRSSAKGPLMNIAYKHVRIAPDGTLPGSS